MLETHATGHFGNISRYKCANCGSYIEIKRTPVVRAALVGKREVGVKCLDCDNVTKIYSP